MKRREFLRTGGVVAAGLVAARRPCGLAAEANDELNVALIGVGLQGRLLLNAAKDLPGVRFRAVCDIWPYARKYGEIFLATYGTKVAAYADYREMLDQERGLDAVLIATPDFVHAEQCKACLDAGLHVYCETMLAHTIPAARSIVEAVRRTGRLLQVGSQRRSDVRYRHTRDTLLERAELPGQLVAVQTRWAQPVMDLRGAPRQHVMPAELLQQYGYADMREFRNWLWFPKFCGGPYCSFVSQQLDVCNWFLDGVPRRVLATGGGQFYPDRPHWDTVLAIYEYPSPDETPIQVTTSMFTNSSAGEQRRYERFAGTEGTLQVSDNPAWVRIWRESNAPDWDPCLRRKWLVEPAKTVPDPAAAEGGIEIRVSGEVERYDLPPFEDSPPCRPHLENFFQAIRGQADLHSPVETAYRSQVAVFKALEAAQAGRTLELQDEDYRV